MKTLDRYIGSRFIWGFLLVMLILVFLFSFLELVVQLDDVGKGNYQVLDCFLFVALTLPTRILDLVSLSALLGSILALGMLADRGELVAMRAAGLSVGRICVSVLAAGGLLMMLTGIVAEFVAPPLEQQARTRRSLAISGSPTMLLTKRRHSN